MKPDDRSLVVAIAMITGCVAGVFIHPWSFMGACVVAITAILAKGAPTE